MGFFFKLLIVIFIVVGVGVFVVAQGPITIPFLTPISDTYIAKCGSDINCYKDIIDSPVRFFTMVHEDGSIEKVILIEEYPIGLEERK